MEELNLNNAKDFLRAKLETIKDASVKGFDRSKYVVTEITKIAVQNGKEVWNETAESAGKASKFVSKVMNFQSHAQSDDQFQEKCTMLYMMMANRNVPIMAIERTVTSAYGVYAIFYFKDQSLNMSKPFMEYLIQHKKSLRKEEDVHKFIKAFEDHCDAQTLASRATSQS